MYLFLGDSHSRQFVGLTYGVVIHQVFSRASMQGISNKNSAIKHGEIMLHSLSMPRDKIVFLMFGGVDLDFSWPRQVSVDINSSFDEFINRRVISMRAFLDHIFYSSLIEKFVKKIYLFLPQISGLSDEYFIPATSLQCGVDQNTLRFCADHIDFSEQARARRTVHFNDVFEDKFKNDNRLICGRIDKIMLNNDFRIKDEYKPVEPGDHHASHKTKYDWEEYVLQAKSILPPPWDYEF